MIVKDDTYHITNNCVNFMVDRNIIILFIVHSSNKIIITITNRNDAECHYQIDHLMTCKDMQTNKEKNV